MNRTYGAHKRRRQHTRILNRTSLILFLFSLVASAASGQSLNTSNIFAGYSFAGANLFSGQHANLNGWNISGEKKYLPFFGFVVDASGHYGSTDIPAVACNGAKPACQVHSGVRENLFQFGLRGSYSTKRIRPFAEFLVGAALIKESGPGVSNSRTDFVETLAAGVDLRITRHFGWRTDGGLLQTGSFTTSQHSVRASTGVVYFF
jgi:hypothetical protein